MKKYNKTLVIIISLLLIFAIFNVDRIINKSQQIMSLIKIEIMASQVDKIHSNWEGKTWNAVGDSITENGMYTKLVSAYLGLKTNNFGLASSTIAVNNSYLKNMSIYERVLDYPDADLWTIFGGVNDWLYKTPVGTINDTDPSTFYGALKAICEEILNRPNHPKLILFTPLQSNRNGENEEGVSMQEYRQAIIDVGNLYNVPVLDLYNVGGINPDNLDTYTRDGIHPNVEGTTLYVPAIVEIIQSLE